MKERCLSSPLVLFGPLVLFDRAIHRHSAGDVNKLRRMARGDNSSKSVGSANASSSAMKIASHRAGLSGENAAAETTRLSARAVLTDQVPELSPTIPEANNQLFVTGERQRSRRCGTAECRLGLSRDGIQQRDLPATVRHPVADSHRQLSPVTKEANAVHGRRMVRQVGQRFARDAIHQQS